MILNEYGVKRGPSRALPALSPRRPLRDTVGEFASARPARPLERPFPFRPNPRNDRDALFASRTRSRLQLRRRAIPGGTWRWLNDGWRRPSIEIGGTFVTGCFLTCNGRETRRVVRASIAD